MLVNRGRRHIQFIGEVAGRRRFWVRVVSHVPGQLEHLPLSGGQPRGREFPGFGTRLHFGNPDEFDFRRLQVTNVIEGGLDLVSVVMSQ